jgi:dTDP-4-dehydrorhamnose reductase
MTNPVLVIGATGQLARALAAEAERRRLFLLCRGRESFDVTDPAQRTALFDVLAPAAVINAAAYTAVDRAEDEQEAAFRLNAEVPGALAAAAAARGIPFIHVSTDYVFDGRKGAPYVEADPTAPLSVYGASKLAGEQAVRAAHPDALILRTAWVYSAFGRNFVRTMLDLAKERPALRVVADQRGNPTAAEDLAALILDLLARRETGLPLAGGIYHAAGSAEASWHEFASAIVALFAERTGRPPPRVEPITTAEWPTRARRPADSRLDCGKLRTASGLGLPGWPETLPRIVSALLEEE